MPSSGARGHLEDVGDGVEAPGVLRLVRERGAADPLGRGERAALLERERLAAEDEAVAGQRGRPGRNDPLDRGAHPGEVAGHEAQALHELDDQQIVRSRGEVMVEAVGRGSAATGDGVGKSVDQHALVRARGALARARRAGVQQRCAGGLDRLAPRQHHAAEPSERVAGDQVRIGREDPVQRRRGRRAMGDDALHRIAESGHGRGRRRRMGDGVPVRKDVGAVRS